MNVNNIYSIYCKEKFSNDHCILYIGIRIEYIHAYTSNTYDFVNITEIILDKWVYKKNHDLVCAIKLCPQKIEQIYFD